MENIRNQDKNFEDMNEEFNNFMHRVTEVNEIVKKLNSKDETIQRYGMLDADKVLNTNAEKILANIGDDDQEIVLKVTSNRTVLNKKALHAGSKDEGANDEGTMSQQAFMDSVSKDADQRFRDRLVRTEKMETFKAQATKAFRRGEFERALCCYHKAIEQIKDSPLLYNNRGITQMRLQLYDKAIEDARTALKLNENCLRSFLLIAKCYHCMGNRKMFEKSINEAREKLPKANNMLNEFMDKLEAKNVEATVELVEKPEKL